MALLALEGEPRGRTQTLLPRLPPVTVGLVLCRHPSEPSSGSGSLCPSSEPTSQEVWMTFEGFIGDV